MQLWLQPQHLQASPVVGQEPGASLVGARVVAGHRWLPCLVGDLVGELGGAEQRPHRRSLGLLRVYHLLPHHLVCPLAVYHQHHQPRCHPSQPQH